MPQPAAPPPVVPNRLSCTPPKPFHLTATSHPAYRSILLQLHLVNFSETIAAVSQELILKSTCQRGVSLWTLLPAVVRGASMFWLSSAQEGSDFLLCACRCKSATVTGLSTICGVLLPLTKSCEGRPVYSGMGSYTFPAWADASPFLALPDLIDESS